ncbi:MAG: twin-arginine translocation signal domain-containing protein, partial [Planctomycetota bacterium]
MINRREFLGAGAAGTGAVMLGTQLPGVRAAGDGEQWPPRLPAVKIHKVYVGRTGGIYLSRPQGEIARFDQYLADVERKLGDV